MNIRATVLFASLIAAAPLQASSQSVQSIADAPLPCKAGQQINEEGYVKIGGIEQWVTIKGADCTNPVILMVHGGPGNPNTVFGALPYVAWEKDFTIVQWDQRGAGRTFTRNPATAEGTLSIAGLANDGTEVAAFVARHLKAKKLILMGGSWGSALSVHMAKSRPELFGAYLSTGQLVNGRENEADSYRKLMALARAANDAATIAALEALGAPPWLAPRSPGQFRKISRGYEAKTTTPAPKAWWSLAPAYASEKMQAEYESGEDYSWIQYVGMKGDGMHATLDLYKLGAEFRMPVFMIVGEQDLTTTPGVAKRYFDAIKAPKKAFFLLPLTGHDPNGPMVDAQYNILKTRVTPLLK
ncbi:alpha/beta hydrolase [Massilia sp. TSP1-1-2]|uniref:alpha/beta hydrolase n=1 Tax=Massilia sp. TSP1-1-2 TaxID=2804649 RepID=UPI003CF94FBA